MLNIPEKPTFDESRVALFDLGFRPFFLGASIFAVISILLWMLLYANVLVLPLAGLSPHIWHGHEMIYGFAFAVVAGFLLTAVKNWTGVQTVYGKALAWIFLCWLVARIAALSEGDYAFYILFAFDMLFVISLTVALIIPLWQARAWVQLGILSKIVLLGITNLLFYLGVLGFFENGITWGLYGGLYLIMGMVFVMARRVVPFFIEMGVDKKIEIVNWKWLDIASLILFSLYAVADILGSYENFIMALAIILSLLHSLRLWAWYSTQIWQKPLLWSLFVAYSFFVLGFVLKVLTYMQNISASLSLHAFAYGGIAMMTTAMMARVSLGHTGRKVSEPPSSVFWVFVFMFSGVIFRVLFPIFDMTNYSLWVTISQLLWISAFTLFVATYGMMFVRARIDGKPG